MINHDASTPSTGIGGRFHYIARELAKLGHSVTVVGARHHHLLHKNLDADALPAVEYCDGYKLIRVDVPRYAHAHDLRRVIAWFCFAAKLPRLSPVLERHPDAVLYSSPQLIGYLGAERLARISKARLVFDVRDIWPQTLIEIGGYNPWHPFIRFLQWIEDRAYASADRVTSNLEGAVEHMIKRGMNPSKFTWVPNGICMHESGSPADLSIDLAAQIPRSGFRIAYTGTLGLSNELGTLIEAASILRAQRDISFILVGDGSEAARLKDRCRELGLDNIVFLGQVPKSQVQAVLANCDCCYIGWKKLSLYRWGIAANKIPEYLISGKPILHGFSGGRDPIAKFSAGFTIPAENPDALTKAIIALRDLPEHKRHRIGVNNRRAARLNYDYSVLAKQFEKILIGQR